MIGDIPSRILAFCAMETRVDPVRQIAATSALEALAKRWGMDVVKMERFGWVVHLVCQGVIGPVEGSFLIGPNLPCNDPERDRHLKLELLLGGLSTSTDYTGSVPVFYSSRGGWVVSNIEPATVLGSGTTAADLSKTNLFGLLQFSHFIWDETLYSHVFQQLPDSRFHFRDGVGAPETRALSRLKTERTRAGHSIEKVATELAELNRELVVSALSPHSEIVLPLSGGYDSRMILVAAAAEPALRDRLRCFTYGPKGSLEVQAAKQLAKAYRVDWQHWELPCRFLEREYLESIGEIFGGSLHFHGMYQLEFVMGIRKELKHRNAVLTSGYMTGVPAGQHISLMMRGGNPSLFAMFNRFGQSKLWPADRLEREFHGLSVDMIEHLENKLSQAFNFVDGNDLQKSVVCDVMTRQRNFISYYPRTIEWAMPHIAPHMNPEYANFFLSLSDEALHDRRCVEEMFLRHYPAAANVFSNSNGLRSIASQWDARLLGLGQRMKNAGLGRLVPERWKNDPLELDGKAMSLTGLDGLWPLAEVIDSGAIDSLVDPALCREWLDAACRGDVAMYDRLVRLQALAWSLESLRRANA